MISGLTGAAAGYNGTFTVVTAPTTSQFTYTDATSGLPNAGGGTVNSLAWFSPANNQTAWELAQMIPVVGTGVGGNAVPWTLLGEAVSVSGVPSPSTSGYVYVNGWSNHPVTPHLHPAGQLGRRS